MEIYLINFFITFFFFGIVLGYSKYLDIERFLDIGGVFFISCVMLGNLFFIIKFLFFLYKMGENNNF